MCGRKRQRQRWRQPSVGRIENLRLTNNSQTLVGDLVGVPVWLAKVMPSAYPRRSIEGFFEYPSRIEKLSPEELRRVAQKYLVKSHRTRGDIVPPETKKEPSGKNDKSEKKDGE